MPVATVSSRMLALSEERRTVTAFTQRIVGDRGLGPDACDFVFGNPQEPPLRGLVEAFIRYAEPRDVHWFAYKNYDPAAPIGSCGLCACRCPGARCGASRSSIRCACG